MSLVVTFTHPLTELIPAKIYQFDRDSNLNRVSLRTGSTTDTPHSYLWLEPAVLADFILGATRTYKTALMRIAVTGGSDGQSVPFLNAKFYYKETEDFRFYDRWMDRHPQVRRRLSLLVAVTESPKEKRRLTNSLPPPTHFPELERTVHQFIKIALKVVYSSSHVDVTLRQRSYLAMSQDDRQAVDLQIAEIQQGPMFP
ncbi:hypothetical protein BDK51DRAFT_26633 [Blyttiomyces helicus]|uniref:Uncharacterized protein n=1 Tax=Blyttiomyces helicus TaxID=388810 RepID=A0A4P9W426_9FUNG|nr:hypothetical protein BDK51DRAFT_26633 [Blyttiomyces helicus]|eukprot:RKO87091.1 hypothetical protein BDK51DRAFT_26633 [Blyttiomyces helicus]